MIVLDTNVISEVMRPYPSLRVVDWLDEHDAGELWLTAITTAELYAGLAKLEGGPKRSALAKGIEETLQDFSGRILPFGEDASFLYGELAGPLLASKTKFGIFDYQIAAITLMVGGTLATRNIKDFASTGVPLVNPWDA